MSTSFEETVTKISAGTEKAVGAYIKLDDNVSKSLLDLQANGGLISDATVKDIAGKFANMALQIKTGMDAHYTGQINTMAEFFKTSNVLTDVQEAAVLEKMKTTNAAKKAEIDGYANQIIEIIKREKEQHGKITKDGQEQIDALNLKMKTNAVKALSDTDIESKVILERIKEYSTRVTAEQAGSIIKNANTTRDKSIAAANATYTETVKAIIKERDETGSISAEQATKLIADAGDTKTKSVEHAQNMKTEVVTKLSEMNTEALAGMNTTTGEMITGWDRWNTFWNKLFFQPKDLTITTHKNTVYGGTGDDNGGGGGTPDPYNYTGMGANWTGTRNWRGGLTTLHEKGYEVYNLNKGSQVLNHEASLDLVTKTAQEVARSVIQGMGNGGSSGPQTNITNVFLDGQKIATVTTPYSNKIQGDNVAIAGRGRGIR